MYWPELRLLFAKARSGPKLYEALSGLRTTTPGPDGKPYSAPFDPQVAHLMKEVEPLIDFLRSDRYGGDPRNLASAMTGVPTISWRRSLDLGQELDRKGNSIRAMGERAMLDHLRRKHPSVFHKMRLKLFDEATVLLKGLKRKCCSFFKDKPDRLEGFWVLGQPRQALMEKLTRTGKALSFS